MAQDLGSRIDAMLRKDRIAAWLFVVLLWVCIGFVLWAVWGPVDDGLVRGVLVVAAVLVLLFNTASISAMVRHYVEDKERIYGLDIRHLDANEAQRRGRGAVPLQPAAQRHT